jgi:hypothetical protein
VQQGSGAETPKGVAEGRGGRGTDKASDGSVPRARPGTERLRPPKFEVSSQPASSWNILLGLAPSLLDPHPNIKKTGWTQPGWTQHPNQTHGNSGLQRGLTAKKTTKRKRLSTVSG